LSVGCGQGSLVGCDQKRVILFERQDIFTERFWRTLKYEEVYWKDYPSPRAARLGLGEYFQFYNYERPHQALDYRTPAELYLGKN
jgi:transposase InsO family protein